MSGLILEASHLSHSFGRLRAVDDISLALAPGDIYGLVGPDGAGKTTTLRLLCGGIRSDRGSVVICGFPLQTQPEPARACIGYLSQRFSLYEDLTVLENIRFLAEMRGLSKSDWLPTARQNLAFVGLDAFEHRLAGRLSGGMKQKLSLACALVNRPQLLLLDEPTTGVDPLTRQDFWQLVIRLAGEKEMAVLICTPYMDEASRCSRVGFMRAGRLLQEGPPVYLRGLLKGRVMEMTGSPIELLQRLARQDADVQDVQRFGDRLHLRIAPGRARLVRERMPGSVEAAGGKIDRLRLIPPQLEDVFLYLASTQADPGSPVENRDLSTALPDAEEGA